MTVIRKILSVLVFSAPLDILVIGCLIKGITPTVLGMIILGCFSVLLGALYCILICKDSRKRLCGIFIFTGLTVVFMNMVALVLGFVMISAPVAFLGGTALWNTEVDSNKV